jgi:hypothetical protein
MFITDAIAVIKGIVYYIFVVILTAILNNF